MRYNNYIYMIEIDLPNGRSYLYGSVKSMHK